MTAMCTFVYLFVVYFSFAPVISASIHRYVNYFDIQVLMMVTETEPLTSTLHHNIFTYLDYVFSATFIYIYIYIYIVLTLLHNKFLLLLGLRCYQFFFTHTHTHTYIYIYIYIHIYIYITRKYLWQRKTGRLLCFVFLFVVFNSARQFFFKAKRYSNVLS